MALITQEQIAAQEKELKELKENIERLQDGLNESTEKLNIENIKLKQEEEQLTEIITEKARNEYSLRLNEKTRASLFGEIKALEELNKDLEEQIAAAKEAGNKELAEKLSKQQSDNNDKISDKKQKTEALETESQVLKEKIEKNGVAEADRKASIDERKDGIKSLTAEIEELSGEIKKLSDRVKEIESDPLLERYNLEVEIRKSHAKNTLRNKARVQPLLFNSNADVAEEMKDLESDSGIFIKAIKDELAFTTVAEEIVKKVKDSLSEEGVILQANEAFELSRKSIFDVSDIMKRIQSACAYGHTSISVDMEDVAGTKLIILNEAGYKISHSDTGDSKKITIDWGFAEESQS